MEHVTRDKSIDGLRAFAALGVTLAHFMSFHLYGVAYPGAVYLWRLAGPLANTSVQIFFVISGFIITSLLMREEAERGRFSIAAFYVRRLCRIVPPLAVLFAALIALDAAGYIALHMPSLASAAAFTCNTGWFVDCQWWVAHTWSLAVEEQFYLGWPLLMLLLVRRTAFLVAGIALLLLVFALVPLQPHSNFIAFACIGAGALCATSAKLREALAAKASLAGLIATAALLVLGPILLPEKIGQAMMPFVIPYLIFASREVAAVRTMLSWRPVQAVGLASYSLYLWQQVFLARPDLYLKPLPLWLLPVAVVLSVVLVEKPFIRLGRRLSGRILARNGAAEASGVPEGPAENERASVLHRG